MVTAQAKCFRFPLVNILFIYIRTPRNLKGQETEGIIIYIH